MMKEKQIEKGVEIYEKFADQFGYKYSNPCTYTAIKFYLLDKKDLKELLLREMMTEFMSNLTDMKIRTENGKLYQVNEEQLKL